MITNTNDVHEIYPSDYDSEDNESVDERLAPNDLVDYDNIVKQLQNNVASLNRIVFNGKGLSDDEAIRLAQTLPTNTVLTHLDLSDNDIGSDGIIAIADAMNRIGSSNVTSCRVFESNEDDVHMSLSQSHEQHEQQQQQSQLEQSKNNSKQVLTFSDSAMVEVKNDKRLLVKSVVIDNSVSALHFSMLNNHWKGFNNEMFVFKPYYNRSIIGLSLFCNDIDDNGAIALANMLATNTSLETLNLECNRITSVGATAIALALQCNNRSLQELHLGNNNIDDDGMKAMAKMLCHNDALTYLSFSSLVSDELLSPFPVDRVKLSFVGVEAIALALQEHNRSLTKLNLAYNNIDDNGATVLAQMFVSNKSLTILDLEGNNITSIGANTFAKVLQSNKVSSLRHLELANNAIDNTNDIDIAMSLLLRHNSVST
jgi:NLR family CARD domain-containing protein 3